MLGETSRCRVQDQTVWSHKLADTVSAQTIHLHGSRVIICSSNVCTVWVPNTSVLPLKTPPKRSPLCSITTDFGYTSCTKINTSLLHKIL